MKNNTVMIANGPRYVGPLLEVEDEETVVVAEGMVAMIFWRGWLLVWGF
jgi:hypothetical protein